MPSHRQDPTGEARSTPRVLSYARPFRHADSHASLPPTSPLPDWPWQWTLCFLPPMPLSAPPKLRTAGDQMTGLAQQRAQGGTAAYRPCCSTQCQSVQF